MDADLVIDTWFVKTIADGSYLMTIKYSKKGSYGGEDQFSFKTSAKLIKFIKQNLLSSGGDKEEEPTE